MTKCNFADCDNTFAPYWGSKYCSDECRVKQHRIVAAKFFKSNCDDPKRRKKRLKSTRDWNRRLKLKILSFYGKGKKPQCCWRGCPVRDLDCLSLDHINNNGAQHRREISETSGYRSAGSNLYQHIKRVGFPEGFQTLCMNHQMKKEIQRKRMLNGESGD